MTNHPRRRFLAALAGSTTAWLLDPIRALARDVKPVRIKAIDVFRIEIPTPASEVARGVTNKYVVAKVETDVGVRGYSFGEYLVAVPSPEPGGWEFDFEGPSADQLQRVVRPALVGKDLFAIEDHLKAGLVEWGGLEHALWDAIGKIAGQPVYRLLSGSKTSIRAYLTCVWPGKEVKGYSLNDQSQVPYQAQAEMAVKVKKAGYKGMKIRAWRPRPLDDADACGEIRSAVGPDFAIMFDRTAHLSGKVWDYPTALSVARALEKHNATWLEEPLDRNDFFSLARLAREVDIKITGGEAYQGLESFRECLVCDSYDILQPDAVIAGGIFMVRKIAAMAAGFHKPAILHGSMGLGLAGWLQAAAAIGAEWQELALITPPLLPEEIWSPALKVLNTKGLFTIADGEIQVPQGPGLGLDINEEALERYRVA
jgi:L-alanine-DL-glutamate epimerase-like enolase superfamily enzyme